MSVHNVVNIMSTIPWKQFRKDPVIDPDGTLVSVTQSLESHVDPWAILRPRPLFAERVFAWHDPQRDMSLAAIGSVSTFTADRASRFVDGAAFCLDRCQQLRRLRGSEDTEPHPLVVGGFGFGHDPGLSWEAWPAALLWIPSMLVWRRGGRCTIRATYLRRKGESEFVVRDALNKRVSGLRERLEMAVAPVAMGQQPMASPHAADGARRHWEALVERARQDVMDGALAKVVVARAHSVGAPHGWSFDPVATAYRLREGSSQNTSFLVGHQGEAFVGATPEILADVRGGQVHTTALAGTISRGSSPADDASRRRALLSSPKDRLEQEHVVAGVVSALRALGARCEVPPEPRVRTLAHVHHLESPIVGRLGTPRHVLEVIGQLHPSPAVGGWPREASERWLRMHEELRRGWYAGPVGWVDEAGGGSFAVAIRSARLRREQAEAYAGAGIVAASDPAAEWRETEHKLKVASSGLVLAPWGPRE